MACAVSFLHEEGIIHCGLHSGNILIRQGVVKLADFGLSKRIDAATNQSKTFGVISYVDPKVFNKRRNDNTSTPFKLNEKSNVYSVGVLLWEITSGRPPFFVKDEEYYLSLAIEILGGLREKIIPSTPEDYVSIYTDCWDNEPDNHPSMNQVVDELYAIKTESDEYDNESDKSHSELDNENNSNELNYFGNLAKRYQYGLGIEKDLEKAFKIYQTIANQDNINAQCIGIREDPKKAFYWYQKSAENKNKLAQYYLAKCYEFSMGIDGDSNKAFEWYKKSYKKKQKVILENKNNHSKNIVIYNKIAKITDFGFSKIENNSTMHIGPCGRYAYIEPQIFANNNFQYIKASDIYSYGVLMWEISSGHSPFKDLDNGAIYGAIHSKNIVIHNDNAKITDFGISKIENNPTRHLGPCGSSAYMEPQILKDHKFIYIKASDIYSYGVLMWEISSGYSPFKGLDNLAIQFAIAFHEDHFAETSNNSNPNSGSQIDNAQIDTYKDLS
ncbi:6332_t:CDS:2, partial [Funneliformis geosporum]